MKFGSGPVSHHFFLRSETLLLGPIWAGRDCGLLTGRLAAFVLVLLWVYYSTQVFLFGAVFTEIYARHHRPSGEDRTLPGR